MKRNFILLVLLLLPLMAVKANQYKLYEIPNTEVVPIKKSVNNGQYDLYIKLPEAYNINKDKDYPVIYFTDAVWHIEMLSASTAFLMEDVILVGISWQKDINKSLVKERGEHVSRFRDYSIKPSSNAQKQAKYQFGQANNHLKFIQDDVIPYIEKNYRTTPNNRTYFGYSLGGLFGAYVLSAQPDTFKNYILGSPSVKKEHAMLSELLTHSISKHKGTQANVFISYGTQEDKLSKRIDQFITLLKAKNDKSLSLHHVVLEGDHAGAFPLTGVNSVSWLANILKTGD